MRSARLSQAIRSCAIGTMLLCVGLLAAWFSHSTSLEAAAPAIFQAKVNSSVGMLCAGAALYAGLEGRRRACLLLAVPPFVIGALTIVEYAGMDLGIDQLLLDDWSQAAGAHPGRPSFNISAVMVLAGWALLLLGIAPERRGVTMALKLAGGGVAAIAMVAVAGYIGSSAFAQSWSLEQPIPLFGSLCAFALGSGLLMLGWRRESADPGTIPVWVPTLLCFAFILLDISTPTDLNIGICYAVLVLCGLWFRRANMVLVLAFVSTVLIVLGLLASAPGEMSFASALINRLFAIVAVWVIALLIYLHHRANRDLRRSRQHFEVAQGLALIGSFELYFSDMRLRSSPAFDTMHGLVGAPAHQWDDFLLHVIPPDYRSAFETMVEGAKEGRPAQALDYSFLLPDGTVRNAVLHADLLFDSAGGPAGLIGVAHDVTEARLAEVRGADIEAQLRHAQKLEALGLLSGTIAHDLNNTLVPITMLTPLLHEKAGKADLPILEIIADAAKRAKELVREMLVYSHKDEAVCETVQLDQMVRESLRIIRAGIPASITIVDDLEPVPAITGNKGQLYQIVLNLATNAAYAIGNRVGTITIGIGIDLESRSVPPGIRFYVEDDGPGMDDATAARIFEPYFSTKGPESGTGLGLSIVSGIVKKHGGTIAVRSTPGFGTRFDLTFPAARIEAAVAA